MNIIGEVKGHDVLILDDMVDTAGTVVEGAHAVRDKGGRRIVVGCTHPVLSGPALERINQSVIEELITTNTIALDDKEKICKKIRALSVGGILGEAIKRIHTEESLSTLFV